MRFVDFRLDASAFAGQSARALIFSGLPDAAVNVRYDRWWFCAAIAVPVVQQVLVALVWRTQLSRALLTRAFGDKALAAWGAIFMPLLFARPLTTLGIGIADLGSLPVPTAVGVGLGCLLLVPAVWALHSVKKYFGIARALGGDHFFER